MPRNGRPGVQLLLETDAGQLDASLESDAFVPEFFCMKAVPVEYNTGDGSEQGGAMVLERRPACKPALRDPAGAFCSIRLPQTGPGRCN